MSSLVRTLRFTDDPKDCAQFVALPFPGRDCDPLLANRILAVPGSWTAEVPASRYKFPISLVCHILAGGPSCLAFSFDQDAPEARRRFAAAHARCVGRNSALVLRPPVPAAGPAREFLVAPLWGAHPSQGTIPVMGMYEASHLAGDFLLARVLAPRRLPVVFDLDETLIKARSLSSLQRDADPAAAQKRKAKILTDPLLSLPEKGALLAEIDGELGPAGMVAADLWALKQYAAANEVTVAQVGTRRAVPVACPYYPSRGGGPAATVHRPVLQLDQDNLLTRIHPHKTDQDTSMVFRVRPYWLGVVRPRLAGEALPGAGGRPIVDAFVCTTAPDTAYAHEVWRVLDTGGRLIPADQWPTRILAEVKDKFLAPALGLAPYNPGAAPAAASPMPLAVILDDRMDVWEAAVRRQILEVTKWEPYQEHARCTVRSIPWGSAPAALDTLRAGAVLCAMHERVFREIDERLVPPMRGRNELPAALDLSSPVAAAASYDAALPPPPWAERLLPELRQTVQPLPLPAAPAAPQQQWAAAGAYGAAPQPAAPAAAVAAPRAPLDPRLAAPPVRQASAIAAAANPGPAVPVPAAPTIPDKAANDIFMSSWAKAGLGRSDSLPAPRATEAQGAAAAAANPAQVSGKRRRDDDADGAAGGATDSDDQQPPKKPATAAAAPPLAAPAEPEEEPPLSAEHPVVVLSRLAQKEGKHLAYDCKRTAQGALLVQVKIGGERKGFVQCASKTEGMRRAAEMALQALQGGGAGGADAGGAPPAAAAVAAPPVPFKDALDFLSQRCGRGNVVLDKMSAPGAPLLHYRVTVTRPGAQKLVGEGKGRGDFQAKRKAAAAVLQQLGYAVTEFMPKHLEQS